MKTGKRASSDAQIKIGIMRKHSGDPREQAFDALQLGI
jgi:hypothetical protein